MHDYLLRKQTHKSLCVSQLEKLAQRCHDWFFPTVVEQRCGRHFETQFSCFEEFLCSVIRFI